MTSTIPTPAALDRARNGKPLAGAEIGEAAADMLVAELVALRERLDEVLDRVEALEAAARPAPKRDDLNDRIVEFMRSTGGLRLTALVIAENIGEDNARVGHRLTTLAGAGVIGTVKEDGRTRMFYALPAKS